MEMQAAPIGEPDLKRALGPLHLIALGIGAIIGAGIFVLTGHAAASYAGSGVVYSFAIAGLGCLFAGLCYAEYAAMIPVAGSAYTYTYATMGRFLAWIIGWNLVLEYLAAGSTVAVGWSGYFTDFMTKQMHMPIPAAFASAPFKLEGFHHLVATGTYFNLPAVALVALVTFVLIVGVNLSANFNNLMVAIKLCIVIVVIFVGFSYIVPANHIPFIPPNTGTFGQFGWTGVFRATGVIFFAYIGFDAVSVAAQEARNPQRDIPIGILGSLVLCTVLYMLMSWVVTGIASYTTLNVAHPVSQAVEAIPSTAWLAPFVNVGAIVGLASVVLVLLLGQSRIFYAMAKDGMIPPLFAEIHPRFRTPWRGSLITGAFCALGAGVLPLDILGELVSIGTLAAFAIVCTGIMILRVQRPNMKRPFRTPLVWIVAPLGIFMCLFMMAFLPIDTWIRLLIWTNVGLAIFVYYSIDHTKILSWAIEPISPSPAVHTSHASVRGWLLVACISFILVVPILSLLSVFVDWHDVANYPALKAAFLLKSLIVFVIGGFSVAVGISLWSIKPNATRLTKNFLLIVLTYNWLEPFVLGGGAFIFSNSTSLAITVLLADFLRSCIANIGLSILFAFFRDSKRVHATYSETAYA